MELPREWTSCSIKDIQSVEVQNGFSPQCVEYETARKSLSLGALTGFSLDLTQEKFISEKAELPLNSMLHKNDILVSRSNTKDKVGRAAVVLEDVVEYYYPDLMMRFQVDSQKADCRYVAMYLQSPMGRNYFMSHAAGTSTSMVKINKNVLESFPMVLPPLAEQKKIAETLSVWDSAIEKMEKLVEKKEEERKINIWNLIANDNTKKVEIGRVSINKNQWNHKLVGHVLKIGHGKDYKSLSVGNVPVYGTGGYMTSVNEYLYDGETVCIGRKGTIDKPFYYCGKIWTVDTLFYTYDFENVLPKYIYYMFCTVPWKKFSEASGVPSLTSKIIENIEFNCPSLSEQQTIADLLSNFDKELSLLKQQLALYKKQKQGLMQKLLTGEWRV